MKERERGITGQFHKPNGAKRKYTSMHSLMPFSKYTQLKFTLNFYTVRFSQWASKTAGRTLMKLTPVFD